MNRNSQIIFENSNLPQDFDQRQKLQEYKKLRKTLEHQQSQTFEFKPKLIANHPYQRDHQYIPIGTYLYHQQTKFIEIKSKNENLNFHPNLEASMVNTMQLVKRKTRRISKQIFSYLDVDGVNLINFDNIEVERIPRSILTLITLLLIELEKYGDIIEFNSFGDIFQEYYKYLLPFYNILELKPKSVNPVNFDFKPELCKKSLKIVKLKKDRELNLIIYIVLKTRNILF